ncbi:MAG: hypothetical protein GY723_09745 [bacterium]|nr:hypothetical protein [bacterium]MCP5067685.1 hypothetical protein [bacterium]
MSTVGAGERQWSGPAQACLDVGNPEPVALGRAAGEGVDPLARYPAAAYARGVFGVPSFIFGEEFRFGPIAWSYSLCVSDTEVVERLAFGATELARN